MQHGSQNDPNLSQLAKSQTLNRAIKWAIGIHIAIFIIAAVGLPSWRKKPFDMTTAVNVDLVAPTGELSAASNKTKIKKPFVPNAKPAEQPPEPPKAQPEKPPTPVKSDAAKKEDVKKPDEKLLEKPKEQVKDPKKLATEKAEKLKLEKKKEEEKKKKAEEEGKKEAEKQEEFNSILKNLLSESEDVKPDGNPTDAAYDLDATNEGTAPTTSDTLALSEMDALRYQLARCWNIPSGAMNAEDLIVDVRIQVNPDRTVKAAEIVDQSRYNSDSFFRAAADSARRAVFNPMCSPLALPADKYEVWKDILIRFNPKDMFGG